MLSFLLKTAQTPLQNYCDHLFACLPQKTVLKQKFVVAHRGVHDNLLVHENTLEALYLCEELNIPAVEFDLRWSKDNHPLLHHDNSLTRIYPYSCQTINTSLYSELKRQAPCLVHLNEVIRLLKSTHLMIEIKTQLSEPQELRLAQILKEKEPQKDYHLMSLDPSKLLALKKFNPSCFIAIAETNTKSMSEVALKNNWAGLAGHYLLINSKLRQKHHDSGQKIGMGFIQSVGAWNYASNKGADWIFSNTPQHLIRNSTHS